MKKSLLIFVSFVCVLNGFSQSDTAWKTGGMGTLNFTQLSLYQWAAGGENSFSGAALLNLFANYKEGDKSWDNILDLGYGIVRQGSLSKKSNDRIDFSSIYGRRAGDSWYYSALLGFRTQFTKGYNYPNDSTVISGFLAPAYITTSLGMNWKPNEHFNIFLSPMTGKMTIVIDDSLARNYGVEEGKNIRGEFGGYIKAIYRNTVMENVDLTTKLDLFSNYLKNPQNVDINWELLISMKINAYLAATFSTLLIYDDDVKVPKDDHKAGPGIQVKEVLGIGLSYKFK